MKCNWDSKRCQWLASEAMKIIEERETHKNNKKKKKKWKQKRTRGTEPILKGWVLNDFVVHLKLGLCKASFIFKSNLELALSIILKQWELY